MFVTFEGLDGSGKTTQIRLPRCAPRGGRPRRRRDPRAGGHRARRTDQKPRLHGGHVAPWAEAALYAASRAQHVEEVIRPALERDAIVLCDRYVDSSVAYQGVARGLGLERVLELNLAVVGGVMPDRTSAPPRSERGGRPSPSPPRPSRTRRRRLPRSSRRRLPAACRALPGADRRPRCVASVRRDCREDPWSPRDGSRAA